MKNKLANFLIALVIGILVLESTRWAFFLMNISDSLLFYLGLSIIAIEVFVGGWYLIKFLNKKFPTEKNDEESK
jgi:hypothetical protein